MTPYLVLALALASSTARAGDCPPLAHLPGFDGGDATTRDYETVDVPDAAGGVERVAGTFCSVRFAVKAGAKEPAPAEIVAFYKAALEKAGAKIVMTDACHVVGSQETKGLQRLTHVACEGRWGAAYVVTVVQRAGFKATLTAPDKADYRLFGHMPGYQVENHEASDQGEVPFVLVPKAPPTLIQGKHLHLAYVSMHKQPAKAIDVLENYAVAIQNLGGEILLKATPDLMARFEHEGHQIFVKVNSLFGSYTIDVIEEAPVSAPTGTAGALKAALDKDGHIALYVHFAFSKSALLPDAAPVIAQVVALLKTNPTYKLSIVGHTDNIGGKDANQALSEARAQSVVDAIAKGGIAKDRLTSAGAGLTQPLVPNDKSEGRAKNRRVELVKQ